MASGKHIGFIQITAASNNLYGLDAAGGVWRYVAAGDGKNKWSFWTQLTSWGRDPKMKDEDKDAKE